jgi:hypothetical protein
MANALRRRAPARSRQPSGESVSVKGTYNIDLKITVEWERALGLCEVETLLLPFLGEARGTKDIRAFLSGHLRESDGDLLPGKISRYRIAPNSLRSLLETLEARGAIVCDSGAESAEAYWLATENV